MAYHDKFRLSSHGIFTDDAGNILLLKATYGDFAWGLPGGSLDPGETIHDALVRECMEELGVEINVLYLSGIYFHQHYDSHTCIFKCTMDVAAQIQLSSEHSAYRYFHLDEMSPMQRQRALDCLQFDGTVKSGKF